VLAILATLKKRVHYDLAHKTLGISGLAGTHLVTADGAPTWWRCGEIRRVIALPMICGSTLLGI